ncbi:hypothetical protein KM043_007910 [Ampulex compressa]|nr:hypothetical protein KM043_007910 [Ampulex compressa]
MTISIILHISAEFKIIGYRLEHMFDEDVDAYYIHWQKISELVEHHRAILRFVQTLISSFTISVLAQLVLIVITLTGLLLQFHMALTPLEDIGFAMLTVCRVVGHFLVLFLNILPGQRVLDASANMFTKIYSSDWYMAPIKTQKLLLFLMQRMIEPTKLSLANILHLKFEMFATITQLSMSYFTVIHSLQL